MAELIIMPKLGFNMDEGKLIKWYKKEGDSISKGEAFFSIETDKTSIDIEATSDGVVRKLFINEGDKIAVTLPIAIVAAESENIEAMIKEAEAAGTACPSDDGHATPAAAAPNTPGQSAAGDSAESYDYDVVVIGGGPGGYVAAIKAAQMGKKTAIVEKDIVGGVCLNRGCIPTKTLLRSVESLREVKESANFGVVGVDTSKAELDMKKVQERKKSVVSQLTGGVTGLLKGNGVTILNGTGSLKDAHTVTVNDKTVTSASIILATGSKVKNLPITIDPKMKVLTSDDVLNLTKAPKSIAIIGGGVIGIEFAYFLASVGSEVTVIEFLDHILPMVDEEITDQVAKMLEGMGVKIYTGAKVTEITNNGVKFEKSGSAQSVNVEKVLMAVGREPDIGQIPCDSLGIKTEKGAIITDKNLRTSVDNIYAIGDVNGKAMLAHVASMEGVVAVENICGHESVMEYDKIPSAIYIQPEIASVGLTEAQARKKYGNIKVGKFPLVANGKAKVAGEEKGIVKVILEPRYNEIIGVHMYCIHATDMISEAVVAMKLEGTAEEIAMSIHPHPTVSETLHEAFHSAIDKAIHFM